jgi:hypothetical protein
MLDKVKLSFAAQVANGPKVEAQEEKDIRAYSRVVTEIPKQQEVDIEVSAGKPDQLQFLMIKSDKYYEKEECKDPYWGLQYRFNEKDPWMTLHGVHLHIGEILSKLLADKIEKIQFKNDLKTTDVTIEILVTQKPK